MSREKLKTFKPIPAQLEGPLVLIYNLTVRNFIVLDHDADLAIEVHGKTLEELFQNAAYALFSIMVEKKAEFESKEYVEKEIKVKGDGELLLSFLNELLYLWDTERFVVDGISIELKENVVFAKLYGGIFDPEKHDVKKEVKAATYHNFTIEKTEDGFRARVVFDL